MAAMAVPRRTRTVEKFMLIVCGRVGAVWIGVSVRRSDRVTDVAGLRVFQTDREGGCVL